MVENTDRKLLQEIREGGGGYLDWIIAKLLLRVIDRLVKYKKRRYDRLVSMGDLFIDRAEKATRLGFGEGTTVYDSSLVIGDVKVGRNTWVGPYTVLDGSGGLNIGDYCNISAGVQIYSHETIHWVLSGGKMEFTRARTEIGNCCYIGPNTIVSKGVRIGNHCLVGANSLVNTDLEDFSMAVGSPCRIVGRVRMNKTGEVDIRMGIDLKP
jgi:acetyltransferase-like isoleucine patch superfamily enzyme